MHLGPLPFPLFVLGIVSCIRDIFKGTRRTKQKVGQGDDASHVSEPMSAMERANISAMSKVVAQYEGYTAEVFDIGVFGKKKVDAIRLLNPGRKVELQQETEYAYNVLAHGEYITDIFAFDSSNLPRLFREKIPFDAYLGGRNRMFLSYDDYDDCKIIVFYKIDGVPPTKVIIES